MARPRIRKGEEAAFSIRPTLVNDFCPLDTKRDLIFSKVVSRMLYGVEVWGVNKQLVRKAHRTMMMAVRWALGVSRRSSAEVVLLTECGLRPLYIEAHARTARLWKASVEKPTWIGKLRRSVDKTVRGRPVVVSGGRGTWTAESLRICNRVNKAGQLWDTCNDTAEGLWAVERTKNKGSTWRRYQEQDLQRTRATATRYVWSPQWGRGFKLLTKLRVGALVLGEQLAQWHGLRCNCWFCDRPESESAVHMLLRCKAWNYERRVYLSRSIRRIREHLTHHNRPCSRANIFTLLIGGAVDDVRIDCWMWRRGKPMTAVGESGEEVVDGVSVWDSQPPAMRVAAFLQAVVARRSKLLFTNRAEIEQQAGFSVGTPASER